MANEIQISALLSASKGGASINVNPTATLTMAGTKMIQNVQNIGTTAEALVFGDLSSPGQVVVKNLDATNYVELALDSAVSTQVFAKLFPGEIALLPAKTLTLYAKANTAACDVLLAAADR